MAKYSKKTSVKELLENATGGLTFRKTFTPQPVAQPAPVKLVTSSQVNEKKIYNRFCDLFGKDAASMNLDADQARAAADVLGYSYDQPQVGAAALKKLEAVEDEQAEMKDRLMKEIKQKISERRRRILQQRRELFEPTSSADVTTVEEEDDVRDLWKAVPALADPDADSSFEEDRSCWDPDAAFSEVERILESLESNAALNDELVGRFRLADQDEDKHSDDSGMSSSADTSNSSAASSSSSSGRQEVAAVVVKPVRKSKQVAVIHLANEDQVVDDDDEDHRMNRQRAEELHIYSVAHDSPVIIDANSYCASERRIRLDLSSSVPTATAGDDTAAVFSCENSPDGVAGGGGRRRSGTLTNSAGEMFGSLRSNLSAGAYSTGEALNRIAQHVSDNIVRPIAETMGEAGDGLVRAAEPLVQHLQLLSTRLQVRYMHAAQHKQWLPHFALMREASDWIEGIPKVRRSSV